MKWQHRTSIKEKETWRYDYNDAREPKVKGPIGTKKVPDPYSAFCCIHFRSTSSHFFFDSVQIEFLSQVTISATV